MHTTSRGAPSSWRAAPSLVVSLAIIVSMLLSGCVQNDQSLPQMTVSAAPEDIADVPAGLAGYYGQTVLWEPCEDGFECAEIEVPVDYGNPEARSIEIVAIRLQATGNDPLGSILINPGGPGASGYDAVLDNAAYITTERLRESYSLVGFDPRGVKRSAPVQCLPDTERDEFRAEVFDLETEQGVAAAQDNAEDFATECAQNTGAVLEFVDTGSAARDMDIIRAATGETELNFLGFSYGTSLGSTYAEIFPDRVGRMVLDGGIDPTLSNEELTLGQARGFEQALLAYAEDCLAAAECPVSGTPEQAVDQIGNLIESVERSPMTAQDGRVVTVGLFVSGLILPLYNDASWPALTSALTGAFAGDPTQMLYLADLGANREQDGSYTSNSNFAFAAINCLDYPMVDELEQMRQDAQKLDEASPTIGRFLSYGGVTCNAWPYEAVDVPEPVSAAGAAPIVVVGTTGDPATPYDWSVALAEQLESGVLVSWEGQGHTAYGRSNECVANAVDDYFIDGVVPDDGTRC